jgi:hypothetical protein
MHPFHIIKPKKMLKFLNYTSTERHMAQLPKKSISKS